MYTPTINLAEFKGHAKGPWQDNGNIVCMGGPWTSDLDVIAVVNEEVGDVDGFASSVAANANARLIAAAPALAAELAAARAECERLRDVLAVLRLTAREYLAVSVPECAETGAELGRESWTPGFLAKYEALEQLADKEG